MALLSCPDCDGKVSDAAPSCPHCGRPGPFENLQPKDPFPEFQSSKPHQVEMESIIGKRKLLGILGSLFLGAGVFAPIVKVPIVGSISYFHNGEGDGVYLLLVALISLYFSVSGRFAGLWFTGLGSVAFLLFGLWRFNAGLSEARGDLESSLGDNPFRGFADVALQSIQLQWGWAVLGIGAMLLVAAVGLRDGILAEWAERGRR